MQKVDFKKRLKHLYRAPAKVPVIVDVPPMSFLMIDGSGDPNTSEEFQQAVEALFVVAYNLKFMIKKGPLAIDYGVLPLESFTEGLCVQVLHVGPFSAEGPTVEMLHAFIRDNGYTRRGKHREIYLSDIRRTAAQRLKTIIRQPIEKS